MKRFAFGFAGFLMTSGAGLAAEPWKTMDTSAGKVYADAKGMTLYTFDNDAANTSNCYDACAAMWPPFIGDKMAKASGDWTVVMRKDGAPMWAYEGKPLYTYSKDKKPGDATGDGVGNVWHVAK
jgi:predicted lipoprotein with Yx(FWY)xxD motif